jgi:hypothetical protein
MYQTEVVEKIKTHFVHNKLFPLFIVPFMRQCKKKIIAEQYRPQIKMWRMRIACCIAKATNTRTEYVILIAFPLQQWLHERACTLGYVILPALSAFNL